MICSSHKEITYYYYLCYSELSWHVAKVPCHNAELHSLQARSPLHHLGQATLKHASALEGFLDHVSYLNNEMGFQVRMQDDLIHILVCR